MVCTTSGGVPAGANSATQLPTSRPLKPCSSAVGTFGQRLHPLGAGDAKPADEIALDVGDAVGLRQEGELDVVEISAVIIGASPR